MRFLREDERQAWRSTDALSGTSSPSLRRCRLEEGAERATRRVGAGHTVAGDVIQALPEALAPLRD